MQARLPYWRLSGFYFFYFASIGGFLPYWSLYLEDIGFNAIEIGELTAMLVGTKVIAPNLWGWIADYTGKNLRIIRFASFCAALLFAGFFLDKTYIWFAWVTVAFSFFWNAVLPQLEAATLFHLKDDSHRYSHIRLWGSVGFIATVLGIGRLLDIVTITNLPVMMVILLTMIWLFSLITPETHAGHRNRDDVGLLKIIKRPEILAFFSVYMLVQMAHGPYYVFFSIYLSENHYSTTIIGLLWALGVIAEVVLFIFMRHLLQWCTLRHILIVSLLLSICRWLLIAWQVEQLGVLIIAQILHAATFGATHIAAIHLVHHYFGIAHQGKGQALYSSLSFGLGGMIGSLYSGFFWDSYGPQWVFSLAAMVSGVALIIALIWVGKANTMPVALK